jgi:hypothetical protein
MAAARWTKIVDVDRWWIGKALDQTGLRAHPVTDNPAVARVLDLTGVRPLMPSTTVSSSYRRTSTAADDSSRQAGETARDTGSRLITT